MAGGLSILMPVFNERSTVEAAIDDALSAELPVATRELVIVDA
jgi:glycosyltransferase involved in cell wall biosynthesis